MTTDPITRARAGDGEAFRELTEPHRRELLVHCYRMLGSFQDAEDALQDTLLAAWRGLGGFEERASVRSWLYRIATNRFLNALRHASRRGPAEPGPPFRPPARTCPAFPPTRPAPPRRDHVAAAVPGRAARRRRGHRTRSRGPLPGRR